MTYKIHLVSGVHMTVYFAMSLLTAILSPFGASAQDNNVLLSVYARNGFVIGTQLPSDQLLTLRFSIRLRNQGQLDRFVKSLVDKSSPAFSKYLSHADFIDRFGPSEGDVNAVRTFLQGRNFANIRTEAGGLLVAASAPASVVESTFNVKLLAAENGEVRGHIPLSTPLIPVEIAGYVDFVFGLNTMSNIHAMTHNRKPFISSPQPYYPLNFLTAYSSLTMPTGAGVNVGIISSGDLDQVLRDFSTFFSAAFAGQAAPPVCIDNAPSFGGGCSQVSSATTDTSSNDEWDLDSQYAIAQAGGQLGEIRFYNARSFGTNDLISAIAAAVNEDRDQVINVSLGGCELTIDNEGGVQSADKFFEIGVAQGQTFSVASGDVGTKQCVTQDGRAWPAVSQYVVAVGATNLATVGPPNRGPNGFGNIDPTMNWTGDTVWNDAYGASGGGPSTSQCKQPNGSTSACEPRPVWQNNFVSGSSRGIPDIALHGSCTPCTIFVYNGATAQQAGTSLAAPKFTGGWARVEAANQSKLGFAAPLLYRAYGALAGYAFHDIVSGCNGSAGSYYCAAAGWDYASGLGSVDFAGLSAAISGSPEIPLINNLLLSQGSGLGLLDKRRSNPGGNRAK